MKFRLGVTALVGLSLLLTGCGGKEELLITGDVVGCQTINLIENPSQEITTECLDGLPGINIAAIKGPAIINVWGSWCAPCEEEIPFFRTFYQQAQGKIELVGVDVEDPWSTRV